MKLYTMAGTCSLAPNIVAAWLDAPIEIENLERGAHKSEDYLKVNPRGQVPALMFDDGDVLTEAVAIMGYIGAAHGGEGHAQYKRDTPLGRKEAELLSYLTSEVHATFKGHFAPSAFADTPQGEKAVRHNAYKRLDQQFQRLDAQIVESGGPYLLVKRSFADAYLYIVSRWVEKTPLKLSDYPNLLAHQQMMETDEGVLLALSRQGMKPAGQDA